MLNSALVMGKVIVFLCKGELFGLIPLNNFMVLRSNIVLQTQAWASLSHTKFDQDRLAAEADIKINID